MSLIDTPPTRTHNDSIEMQVDSAADGSVCPRLFAPHVQIHECADPKLRTACESPLKHLGEQLVKL